MTPLRAFAVDDEPLALRRLSYAIDDLEGVELVGASTSARSSLDQIRELRPDMLLLDVAMPGIDGFELVERLDPDMSPAVVFVTAHDEHAVRAFAVSAVDYLLKPVAPERLREAVAKARGIVEARQAEARMTELRRTIAGLRENAPGPSPSADACFWAHRHREVVRIPVESVAWVQAEGDYVRIHGRDGEGLIRQTLAAVEAKLDPDIFLRVHRSALCRKAEIMSLRRKASGAMALTMADGTEVPVGRSYAGGIRKLLSRMA